MPHTKKTFTSAELEKELEAPYFCGSCNVGLHDLEEARSHHKEDEEHLYHVERRVKVMVPGLAMCPACSQLIQNSHNWQAHHISIKHQKCSHTLNSIGVTGDYDKPLGAISPGEISGPIEHHEIDCHKATSTYGYGKPFNTTGIPIVGLNFIEAKNNDPSKGAKFKCGTCEAEFGFLDRLAHLTSVKHRRFYLKKHYREWFEIATERTPKSREKDKLLFLCHKVELIEADKETPLAKRLRGRFFGLEKHLSISHSKAKNKDTRRGLHEPGRKPRNNSDSSERPPPPRDYNTVGKFHGLQPFPPSKRYKPGPPDHRCDPYSGRSHEMSTEQLDKREAMKAINVLERFSLRRAEQEIIDKMDKMRDAIMRGARLSDIQGYGAMMSSMTRSAPGPDRSPLRGGLLQIPSDRPSHSFPANDPYISYSRPGTAGPGAPRPTLQEDAMYMEGHVGSHRQ
ncbi:uncharacterized protein LOC134811655 isoform X2 [Bolinopsis microptera]|uniref:uncharacterized protein LOC134811655 isoform X2 n=1 Tax=Bolinopsis microptera TaxID=2820187 RepID=UPI0030793E54